MPTQAVVCLDADRSGLRSLFSCNLVLAHATVSASVTANGRNVTPSSFPALAEVTLRRAFIKRIASTDIGLVVPVIRDQVSAAVASATAAAKGIRLFGGFAPVNVARFAMVSASSAKPPLRMYCSPERPISAMRSMPAATSRASTTAEPPASNFVTAR
jgi:hypothetical protein